MINISHKLNRFNQSKIEAVTGVRFNQLGAATLVMTIFLFVLSSLIIIYAANQGKLFTQLTANTTRADQAFHAAEAGLEFAINYLKENKATILATESGGFINYSDSSTTNVVLGNGSQFSVVYTNPIANNFELITITSTGTSADSSATRTVQQQVQHGSLLINPPNNPLISKGGIDMSGSATVQNTEGGSTIASAGAVTLSGSAETILSSGTSSTAGNIQGDITQNSATLAGQTMNDFFTTYFDANPDSLAGNFEYYFTNSTDTNYKDPLDGLTGTSIWIDQTGGTAKIDGNTTIGTVTNPVLLVVNGNFSLSGNVTINGFVFVLGTNHISNFTGNTTILGSLITTDTLNMTGSIEVIFSSATLQNLRNQNAMEYYAKVPGSWRDF